MKGFIIASITLLILSASVIINTIYIDDTTDSLLLSLDSIPHDPAHESALTLCEEFRARWSDFSTVLLLSVDHKAIEDIEDTCATLISHAKSGDTDSFLADIFLLREEIIHLRKAELFSFIGIL